jgi:hypothetical protein
MGCFKHSLILVTPKNNYKLNNFKNGTPVCEIVFVSSAQLQHAHILLFYKIISALLCLRLKELLFFTNCYHGIV